MKRPLIWFAGWLVLMVWGITAVVSPPTTAQTPTYPLYLPLVAHSVPPITFWAEPATADPNQTVTLYWVADYADNLVLTRYWDYRPSEWWENLPLSGQHSYTIPDTERNPVLFTLIAYNSDQSVYASASVTIYINCPDSWFFNPAPEGCPTAPILSPAAEQPFEHGYMLWVGAREQIIVLFDDALYPPMSYRLDAWAGEALCDVGLPPAGLRYPVRGFGYLWCQDETLRARLGWATTAEVGYETTLQTTTQVKYNHTYLRSADGQVWHLFPEASGWEKIIVASRASRIP